MTIMEMVVTVLLVLGFFTSVMVSLAVIETVRGDERLGLMEDTTYDVARAAEIALSTSVVFREPVSAEDMREVLYIDEWEQE